MPVFFFRKIPTFTIGLYLKNFTNLEFLFIRFVVVIIQSNVSELYNLISDNKIKKTESKLQHVLEIFF